MARLALAITEEERQFGPGRVGFRLSTAAARLAHSAFGETVLVYRQGADALEFFGSGRVVGLEFELPGFEMVQLDGYRAFEAVVPSALADELRHAEAGLGVMLADARFDEIMRETEFMPAPGLQEAQAAFAHDRESGLEVYSLLHDRVLQNWGYRCAFTGAQFQPSPARPHPLLKVVPIRPRERGGLLHVRNYLPMVEAAEGAWLSGHLALGSEFGFLVAERLIDPELHDRLVPLGRLDLPGETAMWPDPAAIAYHRANVFDRG